MTIVVTVLTTSQVVQVSDRRRSLSDGTWIEGDHKALSFCNHLNFAHAGQVYIGADEAVEWLGGELSSCTSVRDVRLRVADAATQRVRASAVPGRELGFIGAGWTNDDDGDFRPYWCSITNFEDDFMEKPVEPRHDRFLGLEKFLPREKAVMVHIVRPGDEYSIVADAKTLEQDLTQSADLDDPDSVMRRVAEYTQLIASNDDSVGTSQLVTSLPRRAAGIPDAHLIELGPTLGPPRLDLARRDHAFIQGEDDEPARWSPFLICPEHPVRFRPSAILDSLADLVDMTQRNPLMKDFKFPPTLLREAEEERKRRSGGTE